MFPIQEVKFLTQLGGDGTRRRGWSVINRGKRLFPIFPPKGDNYLRRAINQGAAIILGNMVPIIGNRCDVWEEHQFNKKQPVTLSWFYSVLYALQVKFDFRLILIFHCSFLC